MLKRFIKYNNNYYSKCVMTFKCAHAHARFNCSVFRTQNVVYIQYKHQGNYALNVNKPIVYIL